MWKSMSAIFVVLRRFTGRMKIYVSGSDICG
jgi:hypothetical protein